MNLDITKIFDQVSKIQVKSVTDSLFKYGVIVFILAIITSSAYAKIALWVSVLLFSIGGLFIFIGLFFYCYFSFKNPDYLRSENFQIRKQSIELLGDSDNFNNPNIANIIQIASPSPYTENLGDGNLNNEFGQ